MDQEGPQKKEMPCSGAGHGDLISQKLGNENSARNFSDRSLLKPSWGHGRPYLRVMDVRTEILGFPGFRGPDRSFCPRRPPGYPRGRPRDIRPQNLLFGLVSAVAIYRMAIRSGAKIQGKWERKWKIAPGLNGRKWPPKWKNGPQKWDLGHFPFRRPFFGHFRPGAIFHFLPHFPWILRRTGFPFCRWSPQTQLWVFFRS